MASFPNFRQVNSTDCGPICLKIVSKYYGRYYDSNFLRNLCSTTNSGTTLFSLSIAAEQIGFRAQSARAAYGTLEKSVMPCIVHWRDNHFVVLYKIKNGNVFVSDPSFGLLRYPKEEFLKHWASGEDVGVVLLLQPTPRLYEHDAASQPTSDLKGFKHLASYLRPYKKLIFQLLLGFFGGTILNLIFPFLTQAIVDVGIGTNNIDFIVLVLIAQMVLIVSQTVNEFIRSWITLHVSVRISISLASDFLIKLMKLPIAFFDGKLVGDVRQRMQDNNRIQSFLTSNLISMGFSALTFVVYSIVLALYDMVILLIFYIGSLLYFLWVILFLKHRKALDHRRFSESVADQNKVYEMITGMQDIKLNGWEKFKRWEWERIQIRLFDVGIKSLTLAQNQQIGSVLINQTKNILISFIAAKGVLQGNMTLGMMVAVQYIIGQLNGPINEFIGFIRAGQDTKLSLDRLGEILNRPDEAIINENRRHQFPANKTIRIENVSYGYAPSSLILHDINLTIPENGITAIVGASGSGKTTLVKLLLGFYKPNTGSIKVGDLSFGQININDWRSNCGSVMQDSFIFTDTILNNITQGESHVDVSKLEYALHVSNIEKHVESLPMGYNTKIGADGVGLSQGQRQRVLLARAVYRNPHFIFLDEATNALDSDTEKTIVERLNHFFTGKTVIIVAHRLTTVKNANQIVVLNDGRIAEIGTHGELSQDRGGIYYSLIKNQLEMGE